MPLELSRKIELKDQEMTIDNAHVVAWSKDLHYDIHLENGFYNLSVQEKVLLILSEAQEKSMFKV